MCQARSSVYEIMWDLTCLSNETNDKNGLIPLTTAAKQDMKAWKLFLMSFNGTTLLTDEVWTSNDFAKPWDMQGC